MYRNAVARASVASFAASAFVAASVGLTGCAANNVSPTAATEPEEDAAVAITVRSLDAAIATSGESASRESAPDAGVGEFSLPEPDAGQLVGALGANSRALADAALADAGAPADAGALADAGAPADAGPVDAATVDAGVADAAPASPVDAGAAPTSCDLSGRWAIGLSGTLSSSSTLYTNSNGAARAWLLLDVTGSGGTFTASVGVCALELPSIELRAEFGPESYQVQFPRSSTTSFPDGLPGGSATLHTMGDTVQLDALAVLLGVKPTMQAGDVWPSDGSTVAADADGDGKAGLTISWSTDNGKLAPPLDVYKSARARDTQLAARLTLAAASYQGCSAWSGATGSARLESHVLGCTRTDGSTCSSDQVGILEVIRPEYEAQQVNLKAVRLPVGSRCAEVLQTPN